LKIGTLLPITGDLSQYGSSMQDSARLLVDTVNACGGVLGQPITLVSEDDQTDPAVGAQAMSKLVEVDQVTGVVGAAASSVSAAGVDIAVRNQVMQISPASTSPVFTERARAGEFQGYWARTAAPDTFQGQALAQLAQKQGFKSVAVLAINNDYGNGLIDVFVPAFTALGGTVVNAAQPTRYDPAGTTFEAELRQVFAGRPDAVLLIAYPETGSLILKSAYQLGLLGQTTQLLVTDGLQEVGIAAQVGQTRAGQYIATGMMGTAPSAGGPALQAFQSQYQDRYQRQPKVFDPHTWDAAALLVLAAEAAQGTTGTAMRDRLPDIANPPGTEVSDVCAALALLRANQPINYQGASGSVDLNAQGDVTGWYDVWTIAEDGQLQIQDRILVQPHP
jgi:branched-chain amino acid transport system substrate-binding protein/neutral amino acid transport system substrate-binding protein